MIRVANYTTSLPTTEGVDQVDGEAPKTRDMLLSELFAIVVNAPAPEKGYTIDEIRKRVKLSEALDAATKAEADILLSAEQITDLRRIYDAHKWVAPKADIITASDVLVAAAEGKKEEPQEA